MFVQLVIQDARYKIQDIYFPIPLFVHIEYKYINNIYWWKWEEQHNHIRVVFLLPPDKIKITYIDTE